MSRRSAYRDFVADTKTVSTPWGPAVLVEEVSIPQAAAGRAFTSLVQLLECGNGQLLVRFAYSSGGSVRRGPVTLRAEDLDTLRAGLREGRRLARALGIGRGRASQPTRAS